MSNQEAEPFVAHAEVHGLESRRTTAEVYAAFYNLYAGNSHQDADGTTSSVLLTPRVIHVDETGDRSLHVVVLMKDGARFYPSRRQRVGDKIQHYLPYDPESFIVATTDGNSIDHVPVQDAHGIHDGLIDGICNQYRPENETLNLQLAGQDGSKQQLRFNMASGHGRFDLGAQRTGWILGDLESAHERMRVAPPEIEPAAVLGHLAVVS